MFYRVASLNTIAAGDVGFLHSNGMKQIRFPPGTPALSAAQRKGVILVCLPCTPCGQRCSHGLISHARTKPPISGKGYEVQKELWMFLLVQIAFCSGFAVKLPRLAKESAVIYRLVCGLSDSVRLSTGSMRLAERSSAAVMTTTTVTDNISANFSHRHSNFPFAY